MLWLWGCETKKRAGQEHRSQRIDVFVEQKSVASAKPIVLSVEVYQDRGWSHEPLHVSSDSLDVQWKKTDTEELEQGVSSTYTYYLWGDDGSHIVDAISLVGMGPKGKEEIASPEIFVDIGVQKKKSTLKGIVHKEEPSLFWPVVLTGSVGAAALWYMRRRKKIAQQPMCLEDQYRNQWTTLRQEESEAQEIAIRLSFLLRSYLMARFSVDLLHSSPQEAQSIVQQQKWPLPVREAVLQIFSETDQIRFAGKQGDEELFLSLGRCLEVIFSVGNPS